MDYTRYHPQKKCEGTETMCKAKRKKDKEKKEQRERNPVVVMRGAGRYKGNLLQMSRVPDSYYTTSWICAGYDDQFSSIF